MDKRESSQQTRARELFNSQVDEIMKDMYGSILDFVEVAIGNKERFMPLRSRILRVSNDAVRAIKKELERHYLMDYISDTREVIMFKHLRPQLNGVTLKNKSPELLCKSEEEQAQDFTVEVKEDGR